MNFYVRWYLFVRKCGYFFLTHDQALRRSNGKRFLSGGISPSTALLTSELYRIMRLPINLSRVEAPASVFHRLMVFYSRCGQKKTKIFRLWIFSFSKTFLSRVSQRQALTCSRKQTCSQVFLSTFTNTQLTYLIHIKKIFWKHCVRTFSLNLHTNVVYIRTVPGWLGHLNKWTSGSSIFAFHNNAWAIWEHRPRITLMVH